MVKYGLTQENHKLITEKAVTKRDGVFTFRGVAYRVRDKRVTHFAYNGKILQYCHGFNVEVGKYEYKWSTSAKLALSGI